ncbi:hypothetical protein Tco_0975272 [Tanacetum coccineum]|uniref:Uncharacterized protein n=1 Tax=Tanacetum coccineum TaxID=301880 RepID=A0ABQ5EDY6_9ASTR
MECSSCGALYNKSCSCSKGGLIDMFVRDPNKTPDSSQQPPQDCVKCGSPVDGPYCQGCALWRKKLKEVWFTICHENGIYQDLLNTSESSDDNTNVVNAPQEPFVVKQDPGENSSQSPPQINHNCCYECGDSLDGIFCQRDEHRDTLFSRNGIGTGGNELIKSSVDDLVQFPSEFEDSSKGECDLPLALMQIDLLESLLLRDTSINGLLQGDRSILDEFACVELTLPHSIPPGIDDVNLDPEG